jgi:hypothetical protein
MNKKKISESDLKDLKLFLSENHFMPGLQYKDNGIFIDRSTWLYLQKFNLANVTSKVAGNFAEGNISVDFTIRFSCDEDNFIVIIENFVTGDLLKTVKYPKKSMWPMDDEEIPNINLWCIWIVREERPLACLSFSFQK